MTSLTPNTRDDVWRRFGDRAAAIIQINSVAQRFRTPHFHKSKCIKYQFLNNLTPALRIDFRAVDAVLHRGINFFTLLILLPDIFALANRHIDKWMI